MHCLWDSKGNGSKRCQYPALIQHALTLLPLDHIERLTVYWRPGLHLLAYVAMWQAMLQGQGTRLQHIDVLLDEAWTHRAHPTYVDAWREADGWMASYGPPSWEAWAPAMGVEVHCHALETFAWPDLVSLWITCMPQPILRGPRIRSRMVSAPSWFAPRGVRQTWWTRHPQLDAFAVSRVQMRTKMPWDVVGGGDDDAPVADLAMADK